MGHERQQPCDEFRFGLGLGLGFGVILKRLRMVFSVL